MSTMILAEEGSAVQQAHLGRLVGAFTGDVADVSTIVHLWAHDSYEERTRRRAALQADECWQAFLGKLQPHIHVQRTRMLLPKSYSPLR